MSDELARMDNMYAAWSEPALRAEHLIMGVKLRALENCISLCCRREILTSKDIRHIFLPSPIHQLFEDMGGRRLNNALNVVYLFSTKFPFSKRHCLWEAQRATKAGTPNAHFPLSSTVPKTKLSKYRWALSRVIGGHFELQKFSDVRALGIVYLQSDLERRRGRRRKGRILRVMPRQAEADSEQDSEQEVMLELQTTGPEHRNVVQIGEVLYEGLKWKAVLCIRVSLCDGGDMAETMRKGIFNKRNIHI
ncbi:hypothetical protein K435DRAFT_964233 [Dendrothele bispora CBS 962.96]|uniref:Uncharacterized protein n=1 Tax=Dendrothele bispora (strain CBS 962.96) TaxID=1314807 RepID=A0A4S8MBS3_DENBC|nr:hypothetical protein K435DRAFT_964233 [Dendrothele bispora CBS 962.96]